MKSLRMSFIIVWKVAGELHRPKNITCGSYNPHSWQKGLPFISLLDVDIVEAPSEVQACEPLGIPQSGENIRDEGEGVGVLHCYCVELSVVLDEPQGSILLLHKEYQSANWGFGRLYPTIGEILLEELI